MNKNAREVALETLMRVFTTGSYSNISLNNQLQNSTLSFKDRNFATRLVYGTIQYKLYLEYQLHGLVKTKLKEPYLRPLLLMSLYQIVFLDKVPNRAVLDEANILAKKLGGRHSAGYKIVNGILHSFIRRGEVLPDKSDRKKYLSIKESMPLWLVDYFEKNWGLKRTQTILESINQPAKNTVRISAQASRLDVLNELTALGFGAQVSEINKDELILDRGGIAAASLFKEGKVTIQDEAASLAAASFTFADDDQVLDACSAPGGKTVQIAERIPQGQVIALDIHEKKLRLVKQNAKRMGVADRVETRALDARQAKQKFTPGQFTKILVDAPCSGLGLLRRKPEIRYTKKPEDLMNLAKIQLAILDSVSSLLKKTGELVYSTCSIAVEEDEDVVETFLQNHPNFALIPFKAGTIESETGMLKILPDSYGSDGFFIAKFVMRG